jgi:hypothetical protein
MSWCENNFGGFNYRWWWINIIEITELIKKDGGMVMFIPLREQFRNFDGYSEGHANFDPNDIPPLVLPKENNIFDNSEQAIHRKFFTSYSIHQTAHAPGDPKKLFPKEWLKIGKYIASLENNKK